MVGLGRKPWPIALDIGTENVRLLQLAEGAGTSARCVAGGLWTCPSDIAHDEPTRRVAMVDAVKDLLITGGFKGKRVCTALPNDAVIIKNVRLPEMPIERLEDALRNEAAEKFPFPVNGDHQINYLIAGQIRSGNDIQNEIILFGAEDEAIERHLELLGEMGLQPINLEAKPVAAFRPVARWLQRESDEEAVSVTVDIGVGGAWVVVGRGPKIVFTKFIDVGSKRITQGVCRQLSMDYEEARRVRREVAMAAGAPEDLPEPFDESGGSGGQVVVMDATAVRNAMHADVEALCSEIALCLRYCSVTFRGMHADHIQVAGGESRNAMTVELIAEHLDMECVPEDPFRNVDMSNVGIDDRRGAPSDWSLCAGLAFRGAAWADEQQDNDRGKR